MSVELVVLFNPPNDGKKVLPQLDEEVKDLRDHWTLVVCSKMTWTRIEEELQPMLNARYEATEVKPYDRQNIKEDPAKLGFASLEYRKRPVVAISGENIVAARVGALSE